MDVSPEAPSRLHQLRGLRLLRRLFSGSSDSGEGDSPCPPPSPPTSPSQGRTLREALYPNGKKPPSEKSKYESVPLRKRIVEDGTDLQAILTEVFPRLMVPPDITCEIILFTLNLIPGIYDFKGMMNDGFYSSNGCNARLVLNHKGQIVGGFFQEVFYHHDNRILSSSFEYAVTRGTYSYDGDVEFTKCYYAFDYSYKVFGRVIPWCQDMLFHGTWKRDNSARGGDVRMTLAKGTVLDHPITAGPKEFFGLSTWEEEYDLAKMKIVVDFQKNGEITGRVYLFHTRWLPHGHGPWREDDEDDEDEDDDDEEDADWDGEDGEDGDHMYQDGDGAQSGDEAAEEDGGSQPEPMDVDLPQELLRNTSLDPDDAEDDPPPEEESQPSRKRRRGPRAQLPENILADEVVEVVAGQWESFGKVRMTFANGKDATGFFNGSFFIGEWKNIYPDQQQHKTQKSGGHLRSHMSRDSGRIGHFEFSYISEDEDGDCRVVTGNSIGMISVHVSRSAPSTEQDMDSMKQDRRNFQRLCHMSLRDVEDQPPSYRENQRHRRSFWMEE